MIPFNFFGKFNIHLNKQVSEYINYGIKYGIKYINIKLNDMFSNCFYNSINCQILKNRRRKLLPFPLFLHRKSIIVGQRR